MPRRASQGATTCESIRNAFGTDRRLCEPTALRARACRIGPASAGEDNAAGQGGKNGQGGPDAVGFRHCEVAVGEFLLQYGAKSGDAGAECIGEWRAGAGDFGTKGGERTAFLGDVAVALGQIGVDQDGDRLASVGARALGAGSPPCGRFCEAGSARFGCECVLAGEVAIESAMREACRTGDFGHRHGGDATATEQASGGLEDGGSVGGDGRSIDAHSLHDGYHECMAQVGW
jgi:hypothetical protein